MDDFLPDDLPAVRYYFMGINNGGFYTFIRILLAVLVLTTAFFYFKYRKDNK